MAESIIQQKSFAFALEIVELYQSIVAHHEFVISKQLLRSGTSIGANAEEAGAGISRKDFRSKMAIALKESRETKYWLRILKESKLVSVDVSKELAHAHELVLILSSIVKTTGEDI